MPLYEKYIGRLCKEREAILKPPELARKTSMKAAMDALKEAGSTPDEIVALAGKAKKKAK